MKLACVLTIALFTFGCGYGSNYNPKTGGMGAGTAATVSALVPANASAGGPGFTLTVNGTAFSTNSVVYFGGAAQATTFVTASQLTAAVPSPAIATPGSKAVYVNSPTNVYGVNSNIINFMVN